MDPQSILTLHLFQLVDEFKMDVENQRLEMSTRLQDYLILFIKHKISSCSTNFPEFTNMKASTRVSI